MAQIINITANGDIDGEDGILPMSVWHDILREKLAETYPDATISIDGDKNSYGDSSAWLTDEAEGTEEDISDVVQRIFENDVDENLWVAHEG